MSYKHLLTNFYDEIAATLLNIFESMRFKKGSFRFWGCLPIYSAAAARAAGLSDANIRRRILEVHHEAMGVLVEGHIRPLAVPRVIQFLLFNNNPSSLLKFLLIQRFLIVNGCIRASSFV